MHKILIMQLGVDKAKYELNVKHVVYYYSELILKTINVQLE